HPTPDTTRIDSPARSARKGHGGDRDVPGGEWRQDLDGPYPGADRAASPFNAQRIAEAVLIETASTTEVKGHARRPAKFRQRLFPGVSDQQRVLAGANGRRRVGAEESSGSRPRDRLTRMRLGRRLTSWDVRGR